jgi:large subunit ribosomal protein L31e
MEKEKEQEAQKTEEEQEELVETGEEETEAEEVTEKEGAEQKPLKGKAEEEAKEEKPLEAIEEKKEKKTPSREKKEEEEEIVEERIYTVPLGKAWIMPPRKRSPRAMRMLRSFMIKHMKMEARKEEEAEEEEEPKKLVISNEVNERVWGRGVEKPPRKIRVRAAKDKDGNVTVYLAEGD